MWGRVRIPADTNLHQLWHAVILKPFKLKECILHFWKPLNFINMVPADQDHSCILNTWKSFLKMAGFGVFMIWFWLTNHSFPFRLYPLVKRLLWNYLVEGFSSIQNAVVALTKDNFSLDYNESDSWSTKIFYYSYPFSPWSSFYTLNEHILIVESKINLNIFF